MATCGVCGSNSLMPEHYGSLTLCKKCALKILTPTWKNAQYQTNEEVEQQRRTVLLRANSMGFPDDALLALDEYFQGLKLEGLVGRIVNDLGQTLVICKTYCTVETQDSFEFDAMEREYKKLTKQKKRLRKQGKSEDQIEDMNVCIGSSKVDYRLCCGVKLRMPEDKEQFGFLRIYKEGGSPHQPRSVLFFFGNDSNEKQAVREAASFIENKVDEAVSKRQHGQLPNEPKTSRDALNREQGDKTAHQAERSGGTESEESVFDELLKWKNLLDNDVITPDEYAAKKAQLLGLPDKKVPRKYCAECGTKLPEGAQFCPECGASVS